MKRPRLQFRLSWLMLAVAIVALLLALLDPASAVAVVVLAAIFTFPVSMAQPKRRIKAAAWALSLYPMMVPVCLYTTWLTAWCVLGHRPRCCLDDPKYINPIVDIPFAMTTFSISVWPISMGGGLVFASVSDPHRSTTNPLWIVSAVWLSVITLLVWDPLRVFDWILD